jgi:predicted nucleic acid-binding protein
LAQLLAVLDANVLIPAVLRDTLLRAAEDGLYVPCWSDTILAELERNLVRLGRASPPGAARLIATMQRAFPEATVSGYEALIADMPNAVEDRHVLAAAVQIGAHLILTANLRDFVGSDEAPYGVQAQSPDAFLRDLWHVAPQQVIQVIQRQASDLVAPPRSIAQVVSELGRHAPNVAELVGRYLEDNAQANRGRG